MKLIRKKGLIVIMVTLVANLSVAYAQQVDIDADTLRPHTTIYLSPRSGSFVEGSTFQTSILLDTEGHSVNSVDLTINFDPTKLAVVEPSGGQSILGIWLTPPFFDNTNGVIDYTGVIPGGINTEAGLIGTITFRAKSIGRAVVGVNQEFTRVLLNDGLGSGTILNPSRAEYTIIPKSPEGPAVFSETHHTHSDWYNNSNLNVRWEDEESADGFSYVLDNTPSTVPDNTIDTEETSTNYENLKDGIWYFHIKAVKNNVWGNTTHFLARIDTTPPSKPNIEVYKSLSGAALVENAFVSFFATDNLSGIAYYEVATIGAEQSGTQSPLFVESTSPFRLTHPTTESLEIVVRAVDRAGNSSDASIKTGIPSNILDFLGQHFLIVAISALVMLLVIFAIYYTWKHHIIAYLRKVAAIARRTPNMSSVNTSILTNNKTTQTPNSYPNQASNQEPPTDQPIT